MKLNIQHFMFSNSKLLVFPSLTSRFDKYSKIATKKFNLSNHDVSEGGKIIKLASNSLANLYREEKRFCLLLSTIFYSSQQID
jgi:hypothetical protein